MERLKHGGLLQVEGEGRVGGAGFLERLLRLSRHVPTDVELGFHLCYGDEAHGHFTDLRDSRKLIEIANAISE